MQTILIILIISISTTVFAIVGGVTSSSGDVPAYMTLAERAQMQSHTVVVLNAQNPSRHSRCTGTLIAKNVALTAAHCVPKSLENFFVVPSIYEFAGSMRRSVVKAVVHENYKAFDLPKFNQPNWDIALVQFEGDLPVEYRPTTWVASFAFSLDRFWLYVAGYGITQDGKDDSGELRFSRVIVEEAKSVATQSFLKGNQSGGEGICKGDSGGPAYVKIKDQFYVLGIVSAIVGGCRGQSYFNQTLYFQNWIQQSLSQLR